ncbi:MAG: YihA family ribosome biogenesis GTP-binding protein [Desulfobacteraceae bacterium IS3]|nr:MAG: YihA family ribosome biogenesis GTP-binding protein [Desulfobacteraceae bacterium IS3]
MIIKSAEFLISAAKSSQYPPGELPEIAFAGRSNVGKSSLINTLVNRKHLVKTSSTPGRTRLLNFFAINESFAFVDLPGYGYARVPDAVKKQWGPMIETYLSTRTSLKGVVLITDIRRIPGDEDLSVIEWLKYYGIPKILVLTKADKLSKTQQIARQIAIAKKFSVDKGELLLFSATSRQGKERVWESIETMIGNKEKPIISEA